MFREGSRSWGLTCIARIILERAYISNLKIQPVRVSTEENIYADAASRCKLPEDWCLEDRIFRRIMQAYGQPDIDLMASQKSRKVPFFYSWNRQDQEALDLDALSPRINWAAWEKPYLFPPFPLIAACLEKIRIQQVPRIIVILPYWPGKVWFSRFLEMAVDVKRLPPSKSLITDMVLGKLPRNVKSCRLVVSILSGVCKKTPDSYQNGQESSLRLPGDQTQNPPTQQVGGSGLNGAVCMEYRHITQL